jgi:hypothetical protein
MIHLLPQASEPLPGASGKYPSYGLKRLSEQMDSLKSLDPGTDSHGNVLR